MKQEYVAPEIEEVDVEVVEMLAVSSIGYTSGKASDEYEALSNRRRGRWGDLWAE